MLNSKKVLAIIPARGGSVGIPRKNIKILLDKPLIAYSIEQGLNSKFIDKLIVSTDDEEIAGISKKFGAEVPFLRPAHISANTTPDLPVFEHALLWLREFQCYKPEYVVHLRCTSPLRKVSDIDEAIAKMDEFMPDSVISVSLAKDPPQKMWRINQEGKLFRLLPKEMGISGDCESPRQTLEPVYSKNGVVDVIRFETIMEKKSMFGDDILPLVTEEKYSLDIDTHLDFFITESVLKERIKHRAEY